MPGTDIFEIVAHVELLRTDQADDYSNSEILDQAKEAIESHVNAVLEDFKIVKISRLLIRKKVSSEAKLS